jgi:hypothetical protein
VSLNLEDGNCRLCRNFGKKLPIYTAQNPERVQMPFIFFVIDVVVVVFVVQKIVNTLVGIDNGDRCNWKPK